MSQDSKSVNAMKQAAASRNGREEVIIDGPGGVKIRILPVATSLIDEVSASIKDPKPPIVHNPDKDRDEPNPLDPEYLEKIDEASRQRGLAAVDALVMFGCELVDGMPEDETWLNKLKWMEKRGSINLSGYDLTNPFEKEFVYKRYVLADGVLLNMITRKSGLSQEAIRAAERSFPGNS